MAPKKPLKLLLLCLLFSLTACSRQTSGNSSTSDGNTQLSGKHHIAIEVNNYGTIDVELDADTAPINPHIEPIFLQMLLLKNKPIPVNIIAILQ